MMHLLVYHFDLFSVRKILNSGSLDRRRNKLPVYIRNHVAGRLFFEIWFKICVKIFMHISKNLQVISRLCQDNLEKANASVRKTCRHLGFLGLSAYAFPYGRKINFPVGVFSRTLPQFYNSWLTNHGFQFFSMTQNRLLP